MLTENENIADIAMGFAILPAEDFRQKLVEFQQKLRKTYSFSPVLGDTENLPHVTIFQGRFKPEVPYGELLGELATAIASSHAPVFAKASHVAYKAEGWYFLMLDDAFFLKALHNAFLPICAEYLHPSALKSTKPQRHHTTEENVSFMQYGYRYAGDSYLPHVTLGRLKEGNPEAIRSAVNTQASEAGLIHGFHFDTITAYAQGENGAHSKTLIELKI